MKTLSTLALLLYISTAGAQGLSRLNSPFAKKDLSPLNSLNTTDQESILKLSHLDAEYPVSAPVLKPLSPVSFDDTEDENDRKKIYRINAKYDVPLTVAATAWTLYGFSKIYSKERSSEGAILALDRNNIPGFDRWATKYYSTKASTNSDMPFYLSMPLPLLLFLDRDIRRDFGKIAFLYLETMAITGVFYTGSATLWDRYRPYTYNPNVSMDVRTGGVGRNSFLGGHPALVATSTFFMAKVYSDYHPESNFKYVLYGGAAALTGYTAYLRLIGGKHFPSDLLTGITIGTAVGILTPHLHKPRITKSGNELGIVPFGGKYNGVAMLYKF